MAGVRSALLHANDEAQRSGESLFSVFFPFQCVSGTVIDGGIARSLKSHSKQIVHFPTDYAQNRQKATIRHKLEPNTPFEDFHVKIIKASTKKGLTYIPFSRWLFGGRSILSLKG